MYYNYIYIKNRIGINEINRKAVSYIDLKTEGHIIIPDPNNPELFNWIQIPSYFISEAGANVISDLYFKRIEHIINFISFISPPFNFLKIYPVYNKLDLIKIIEGTTPGEPIIISPTEISLSPSEEVYKIGDSISDITVAALRVYLEYFQNWYDLDTSEGYVEPPFDDSIYHKLEDFLITQQRYRLITTFFNIISFDYDEKIKFLNVLPVKTSLSNTKLLNDLLTSSINVSKLFTQNIVSKSFNTLQNSSNFLLYNTLTFKNSAMNILLSNSHISNLSTMNYIFSNSANQMQITPRFLLSFSYRKNLKTIKPIQRRSSLYNRIALSKEITNSFEPFLKISKYIFSREHLHEAYTSKYIATRPYDYFYSALSNIKNIQHLFKRDIRNLIVVRYSTDKIFNHNIIVSSSKTFKNDYLVKNINPLNTKINRNTSQIIVTLTNLLKEPEVKKNYNWILIHAPVRFKVYEKYNWVKIENPILKNHYNYIHFISMNYCQQPRHGIRYLVAPFNSCANTDFVKLLVIVKLINDEYLTFDVRFKKLDVSIDNLENVEEKINHKIILKSNQKDFISEFPPIYLKVINTQERGE